MTDLNPLLRIYCDESRGADERHAAARKIGAGLLQPRQILSSPVLGDRHPLKNDALLVSDAFEAVTNGMVEPEMLLRLNGVPVESPLHSWVLLIMGIRALYSGEIFEAAGYLEKIDNNTAPFFLARPLLSVLRGDRSSAVSPAAGDFLSGLFRDDRVLRDAFVQLETCSESGLDELLMDTFVLLLKEFLVRDMEVSRKLFFWGMSKWGEILLSDDRFPVRIRSLFGRIDGMEILAESTREFFPDRSLIFHLEAFEALIRETVPDNDRLSGFRKTVKSLWNAIEENYEVDESYKSYYLDKLENIERQLVHLVSEPEDKSVKAGSVISFSATESVQYVQLDLFS